MVKPARPLRIAALMGTAVLAAGCSLVPKERLDECHKLSQSLQAETAQLKDVTLKLRATNQDLAERALDDAHRIQALDETNQRLEQSVLAYQQERDQLSAAFDQIKRQIASSVDRSPAAMLERLDEFARAHPGCVFNAETGVSTFPADLLFRAGSDQWQPGAESLLDEYAKLLDDLDTSGVRLRLVSYTTVPSVRRASIENQGIAPDQLAKKRAERVRDRLASSAGLEPAQLEVVAGNASETDEVSNSSSPSPPGTRIEIQIVRIAEPQGTPAVSDPSDVAPASAPIPTTRSALAPDPTP